MVSHHRGKTPCGRIHPPALLHKPTTYEACWSLQLPFREGLQCDFSQTCWEGAAETALSSTCHTSTEDLVLIPGVVFKTVRGGVPVPAALGWQGLAVPWSPSQHS